ncbi:adenylosuccinate lyase [Nannizzia gypsea CBS 118893]|uniref:Adenylosuccinate lyase n=1 Tax=Arthroderma gypseum (strain ATCC MYA-4604 / CBS 118893) TaxID=535722 RepID=E4V3P6_ARTGP|nr:adenylosuccinate lyase [Nannizzia gypsea CBS 118893]EFR04620.1 adenylosuccinate lyase [Nannizzia gypsea CBS 118893]
MSANDQYQTPLASRYASNEMKTIFSARERASTWRKLWLWLAEAEKELGIKQISDEAIEAIKANVTVSDEAFKVAAVEERRRRHDVMAHVYALEKDAPAAAGVIHLGATSCYDNADLIFIRDALDLILPKLAKVIHNLAQFSLKYKDLPALGFTHYQAAQAITLGRRGAQWLQDLVMDLEDIEYVRAGLKFRGAQGTTGTQASFMEIFQNDASKIDKLNEILCKKAGFSSCYDISTQTYTRKVDLRIANALAALGATAVRIATDLRHLAHDKVMEEPFEKDQIGSSAMAYKRNPNAGIESAALAGKLSNVSANFSETFSGQWLERTLDDSAIRRIDIPEMFLMADAILISLDNITNGLVVYPAIVNSQLREELPFMATENIIMKLCSHGVSRQEAHEEIRVLSHQAAHVVKMEGGKNDLIERIKKTEFFKPVWDEIDGLLDTKLFIGRSPEIVERYAGVGGPVEKKLEQYKEYIMSTATAELSV